MKIFDVSVVDFIDIIRFNVGDEVTVEYKKGEQVDTVLSLNGKASNRSAQKLRKKSRQKIRQGILHRQNKRKKRKKEVQPENGSTSFLIPENI